MNYSSLYQKIIKAYSLVPRYFRDGYAFSPIQVVVEVTYKCNLGCGFCQFLRAGSKGKLEEMEVSELLEALRETRKGSIISFTGGEPFVKPGFMGLLEKVSKRNRTHIFTNGTLIDDHTAGRLIDLGARNIFSHGLVLVGVSLEGLENTHNGIVKRDFAFQRTVSAVRSLVKYRRAKGRKYPLIEVKAVISKENVAEIHALFSLAREAGADIFNIMAMNMAPHHSRISGRYLSPYDAPPPVEEVDIDLLKSQFARMKNEADGIQLRTTPQGIGLDEIISYYENRFRLSDYTCYYPWYGLTIAAHGDMIVCPYREIGNLREGGMRGLYNNKKARGFRKILRKEGVFPGCLGCCFLVKRPDGPGSRNSHLKHALGRVTSRLHLRA
jgi:MoaA/NifB/PqqE/SkfB family radical SAM enzyme